VGRVRRGAPAVVYRTAPAPHRTAPHVDSTSLCVACVLYVVSRLCFAALVQGEIDKFGFMLSTKGTVYRTTDYGLNWLRMSDPSLVSTPYCAHRTAPCAAFPNASSSVHVSRSAR
jgi:hypothetical protein